LQMPSDPNVLLVGRECKYYEYGYTNTTFTADGVLGPNDKFYDYRGPYTNYTYYPARGCIGMNDIWTGYVSNREECKSKCDEHDNCASFEWYTSTYFGPMYCQLSSNCTYSKSVNSTSNDPTDLYVKKTNPHYFLKGVNTLCTGNEIIHGEDNCKSAAVGLNLLYEGHYSDLNWPKGCFKPVGNEYAGWNIHSSGTANQHASPICKIDQGYEIRLNSYCNPYRGSFQTLSEAKQQCTADLSCAMVYDSYDNSSNHDTFRLCDGGATISGSTIGSHLHVKIDD